MSMIIFVLTVCMKPSFDFIVCFLQSSWKTGCRVSLFTRNMGRGVSSGGGQSSLGYLFGSGEAPKPTATEGKAVNNGTPSKPAAPQPVDITKQIPAGINSMRADNQNTGNFITV